MFDPIHVLSYTCSILYMFYPIYVRSYTCSILYMFDPIHVQQTLNERCNMFIQRGSASL